MHLITETPRAAEGLLYALVVMTEAALPFLFFPFLRERTKNTLNRKTARDYRNAGLRKLFIAAAMIALPLLLTSM